MNYLKQIDLWAEQGRSFDEILDGLHLRTDDECYTAFHWIENQAHRDGAGQVYPSIDHRDPVWLIASMPKRVIGHMKFSDGTPAILKELAALGAEHVYTDVCRRAGTLNQSEPSAP